MRPAILAVAAAVMLPGAWSDAPCCVIGFDDLPDGTPVTDQYLG